MIGLLKPSQQQLMESQLDITAPINGVEIIFNEERRVLWVNIDGICVLRICQIKKLDSNLFNKEGD